MKTKKILLACLMAASFGFTLEAQVISPGEEPTLQPIAVSYAYDNAGNRVEKSIAVFQSKTKAAENKSPEYIKEELGEQVIKVYPNPTDGQFAVEVLNGSDKVIGKFSLFSLSGEVLQKKEAPNGQRVEFDLSGRVVGTYILKIELGEEVSSWKIIKK